MQHKKKFNNQEYIYVKIISPNFELKYNLSEEETVKRLKKLIKYSNIEKGKKLFSSGPRSTIRKIFFEIEKYKNLIKENFSSDHLIVFGINTLNNKRINFLIVLLL